MEKIPCVDCLRPYKEACDLQCPRLYEGQRIDKKEKPISHGTEYVQGIEHDVWY